MPRNVPESVHHFVRVSDATTGITYLPSVTNGEGVTITNDGVLYATGAGTVTNFTYLSYALNTPLTCLPDYSDFFNLFDQYMITKVELTFKPFQHAGSLFAVVGNQSAGAMHYSVLDYDDATPPTASNAGVQKLREYASFHEQDFFKSYHRSAAPAIAMAAFSGSVFTSYANVKHQWLDMVSTGVEHYCHKGIVEVFAPSSTIPTNIWFRPEIKVWVSFRTVR